MLGPQNGISGSSHETAAYNSISTNGAHDTGNGIVDAENASPQPGTVANGASGDPAKPKVNMAALIPALAIGVRNPYIPFSLILLALCHIYPRI